MAVQATTAVSTNDRYGEALRDAAFVGVVSLGLFVLIVGLRTEQNFNNQLVLSTRWGLLASMVGLIMLGRFLLTAFIEPKLAERRAVADAAKKVVAEPGLIRRNFARIGLVFLFAYPVLVYYVAGGSSMLKWVDNFGIIILIYVMLGWGLSIVVGLAGLLDLGYVAFYAIGSYAYTLLANYLGWSFWTCLPVAGILAAFWGVILGFPVLRLRGDYLAIVTLAFGEIIYIIAKNWREFTGGGVGMPAPKIDFFGIPFTAAPAGFAKTVSGWLTSAWQFVGGNAEIVIAHVPWYRTVFLYYTILSLALITAFVVMRLRRMPVGRAWEALREDEIASRALGINTTNTKLTAFAVGAFFGGMAGSFFAARQGFIDPESFRFLQSAIILAIVVLGGMGSLVGVAIAAVVMIGGTEALREIGFLKVLFGEDFKPELFRMLLFGLAMIVVMLFKPRGFVDKREPTAFLHTRKIVSGEFTKEGHG
jgi:branched-chain amino acid transport system permease protein